MLMTPERLPTDLILGIDGGGSKTRALVADRDGAVLGVGVAASSNYQSVGFESAVAALEAAMNAALRAAGYPLAMRFTSICLGLAGVDRDEDRRRFEAWIAARGLAERWAVVNDAELVLAAGTPEGWGVALICGTGSICFGKGRDGRRARAGGWGYLLGDEGSGYDIAVRALRLATQTADGRADARALLQTILAAWSLDDPTQLISVVYRPETTRATIADLARHVIALAATGDPHAAAVIADAACELGRLIAAVVRHLDLESPPVAIGGGLIGAHPTLQQLVLERAGIPLGPLCYVADPAQGALVIAKRQNTSLQEYTDVHAP